MPNPCFSKERSVTVSDFTQPMVNRFQDPVPHHGMAHAILHRQEECTVLLQNDRQKSIQTS